MGATQETQTQADDVQTVTADIAAALGEPWTYEAEPGADAWRAERWAKLRHADGASISVYRYQESGGAVRLSIRGDNPTLARSYRDAPLPSITVRAGRTPEAIAQEIKRRLLPDYMAAYAVELRAQRETLSYEQEKRAKVKRISTCFGIKPPDDGQDTVHWSGRDSWAEVQAQGTGSSLKLRVDDDAKVEEIIAILRR